MFVSEPWRLFLPLASKSYSAVSWALPIHTKSTGAHHVCWPSSRVIHDPLSTISWGEAQIWPPLITATSSSLRLYLISSLRQQSESNFYPPSRLFKIVAGWQLEAVYLIHSEQLPLVFIWYYLTYYSAIHTPAMTLLLVHREETRVEIDE